MVQKPIPKRKLHKMPKLQPHGLLRNIPRTLPIRKRKEKTKKMKKETGLKDINGIDICIGDIVEWDDAEGTRTAKVIYEKGQVVFHCFKNSTPNWAIGHKFRIGTFMYADTQHHLRIIPTVEKECKK